MGNHLRCGAAFLKTTPEKDSFQHWKPLKSSLMTTLRVRQQISNVLWQRSPDPSVELSAWRRRLRRLRVIQTSFFLICHHQSVRLPLLSSQPCRQTIGDVERPAEFTPVPMDSSVQRRILPDTCPGGISESNDATCYLEIRLSVCLEQPHCDCSFNERTKNKCSRVQRETSACSRSAK